MASNGVVNPSYIYNSTDEICVPVDPDLDYPIPNPPRASRGSRTVIHVEAANKHYGSLHVLKDFNMVVQEHTIYGLLGSSGCGKTTILSCIVALRKLDSGNIFVCGEATGTPSSGIPGKKVGYMPQEIALNLECTPKEVIAYFGRIYGMSHRQIEARHDYLISLLELEQCVQPIECLSDGQKRRVSMAVALIHQPDILILDEPTVGCDPLLREAIWKYLHELVLKRRATVIVTTHYIEEMREADRVGIMRNGQLLCEDAPTKLLETYNETLLDNVMVKLCRKNENPEMEDEEDKQLREWRRTASRSKSLAVPLGLPGVDGNPVVDVIGMKAINIFNKMQNGGNGGTEADLKAQWRTSPNQTSPFKRRQSFFVNTEAATSFTDRMRALIVKNWLVLIRNLWFSLVLIMLPSITVAVFCVAVGSDPSDLRLGVVNFETGKCLEDRGNNTQLTCDQPEELSCTFLQSVNQDIMTFVPYNSVEDAIEDTRQRYIWGYVMFQEDFSPNFFKRIVEGDTTSNDTLTGSEIYLQLDMAGVTIGLTIQKLFLDGYRNFVGKLLRACDIDANGRDLPVTFGPPIFGNVDDTLTNYMGPGMCLGFVFFMCALQCGLTYIVEKKDGMLNRTMVSGVTTVEIMLSHFLVQLFSMALTQIVLAFLIVHLVFGVPLEGSLALAFFLVLLNSIAGMSLGFMLSTFCNDEKYAMLMAMGMVFPNYLLAGLIWPVQGLPVVLQYFSLILPCSLAGEAYRSILLRGFGLTHHVVWYGFAATLIWICIYWVVIILWHKFAQKKK